MSDRVCATGCDRPVRDTLVLCEQCIWELKQALGNDETGIPALVDALGVTLTRQSKMVTPGGKGGKGKTQPLPYDARAADIEAHLRGVLVGWVRDLASENPALYPLDSIPAMAEWLLGRIDDIAAHPAADDIHAEITDVALHPDGSAWKAIDRPADLLYAGICGATIHADGDPGDGDARGAVGAWRCEESIYAKPGAPAATCRACGAAHNAQARRDKMLADLDGRLLTAAEIAWMAAYLVADLGRSREATRKLINQWHRRGRIEARGTSPAGDPRFRFDEVRLLLAQDRASRERHVQVQAS